MVMDKTDLAVTDTVLEWKADKYTFSSSQRFLAKGRSHQTHLKWFQALDTI